ncbi:hypothetical protein BDP27DRAFT_274165 [Rhodocollybia butyracea]|uniref:SET domain-containing protein n=1 Tax=Rhodocollybia butyracea TaxID=206335 RepID=A0A9P5PIN7_9AGAR|nr:hypothetical protein BDP27DRAFT_274165 [Rhodocollybia butyracea]
MILATPGFPKAPLLPTGGSKGYRIAPAGANKGLGIFATRHIKAGELIIDERPLLVLPATTSAVDVVLFAMGVIGNSNSKFTEEEQCQIRVHAMDRAIRNLVERMSPEKRKAFMELSVCKEQAVTGEFYGRLTTNGILIDHKEFNDELLPGNLMTTYNAICDEISRINHSCSPNATFYWNTASFSVRIHAVRDIPVSDEITISYHATLQSFADRAKALTEYSIKPCMCGPACDPDPARIRAGDARRASIMRQIFMTKAVPLWHLRSLEHGTQKTILEDCVKRLKEMEEECLEDANGYGDLLRYVVEGYAYLGKREEVLKYAKKLERACRAFGESFDERYLSKDGMERIGIRKAGERESVKEKK